MSKIRVFEAESEYEDIIHDLAVEIALEQDISLDDALKTARIRVKENPVLLYSDRNEAQLSTFKKLYGKEDE